MPENEDPKNDATAEPTETASAVEPGNGELSDEQMEGVSGGNLRNPRLIAFE